MNVHEVRRYQMLAGVREFAVTYRHLFAAVDAAPSVFAAVNAAVDAVERQAAAETSSRSAARERTSCKAVARARLRGQLAAIARTARALAHDHAGLDADFKVPKHARDFELATQARAVANAAAAFEREFIAYALPTSFLVDLYSAITAFESAIAHRQAATSGHVAARVGIEAAVAEGFQAVLRLDAIVANCLPDDSVARAVWRVARRVRRSPRRDAVTIVRGEAAA